MKRSDLLKRLYLTGVGILLATAGIAQTHNTYTNPLRTADGKMIRVADPFVFRYDSLYYMTGTTRQNSGFDCYSSPDLVHWTFLGEAYTKPEGHPGTGGFWAPEVFVYRGKFYMTYSSYNPKTRIMLTSLAVADSPEGPYRDLYSPWFDFGYSAIDCHIFQDDDPERSLYLFFSRNTSRPGISIGQNYVVRLKDDLSGTMGAPEIVVEADQPWEMVDWESNRATEGAFVFKYNGKYYMTYSANNTGYEYYGVGYATADHPMGPWTKAEENPILATDLSRGVSSPGHNSIVFSPDSTERFIIYHRHADPEGARPSFDRVVCIDRLVIDSVGRLRVVGPTSTPQPMPSGVH